MRVVVWGPDDEPREVEMTDAETVVHDWFDYLLDHGFGVAAAVEEIAGYRSDTATARLLEPGSDFAAWLRGDLKRASSSVEARGA